MVGLTKKVTGFQLGDGSAQVGQTMTSPDGSEWCQKVWDDGVLNMTSGAC